MASDLWMVVGLGNPGRRYQGNRHNVGFMAVDRLLEGAGLSWRSSTRFSAEMAKGAWGGQELVLVKPQTFMNLSGRSVQPLAGFYDVPPARLVVLHDDVDLEPGRLKIKVGGGDGGHKGIRSVAQELGSPAFVRVRWGVGRPAVGEVTDFVLQDFNAGERHLLEERLERAVAAVREVLTKGVREAMNRFNGPAEGPEGSAEPAK